MNEELEMALKSAINGMRVVVDLRPNEQALVIACLCGSAIATAASIYSLMKTRELYCMANAVWYRDVFTIKVEEA